MRLSSARPPSQPASSCAALSSSRQPVARVRWLTRSCRSLCKNRDRQGGGPVTIQPVAPRHLLTVAEYLEIGEIELGYSELVEGRLLMSPSPAPDHNYAVTRLLVRLESVLPPGWEIITDLDVDLQLAPAQAPGTVRRPDLLVAAAEARQRVRREGGVIRASEVALVV